MQRQVGNLTFIFLIFYLVLNMSSQIKTIEEESRSGTSAKGNGRAKPSHIANRSRRVGSSHRGDREHLSFRHQTSQP